MKRGNTPKTPQYAQQPLGPATGQRGTGGRLGERAGTLRLAQRARGVCPCRAAWLLPEESLDPDRVLGESRTGPARPSPSGSCAHGLLCVPSSRGRMCAGRRTPPSRACRRTRAPKLGPHSCTWRRGGPCGPPPTGGHEPRPPSVLSGGLRADTVRTRPRGSSCGRRHLKETQKEKQKGWGRV